MQTSSFFHPLTPLGASFPSKLHQPKRINILNNDHNNRVAMMAFKKDGSNGKMVDENMIVLRERIRKVKTEIECNDDCDDQRLSDNLMQWEKTYIQSGGYHSDIYEGVAVLQRFLMESRPSVALGLVVVLVVGGSSVAMTILQCLMNLIQGS